MPEEMERPSPHWALLFLIAFVLQMGSYVTVETLSWTNRLAGLENAIYHSMFVCLSFILVQCPIMGGILLVLRWWRPRPWLRTLLVCSPVLVLSGLMLWPLVTSSLGGRGRFARVMDFELPTSVSDFRSYHSGGGITDFQHMYSFKAPSHVVDALLRSRDYEPNDYIKLSAEIPLPVLGAVPPQGWPNPSTWDGWEVYGYRLEETGWFYYVVTDETHERVFVVAGCL